MSTIRPREAIEAEAKEPVLAFAVAKAMPYGRRMAWTMGLLGLGLALQVGLLAVWPGLPFLLAALVLSWVRGFDNRLDRRGFEPDANWTAVPFEKIEEIPRLDAAMKSWDRSGLDISSPLGCFTWFALIGAVVAGAVLLAATVGGPAPWILAVDGAVLLLAQWFSGMRTVDRSPDLVLKARHLAETVAAARETIDSVGGLAGQVKMTGRDDRKVPDDVRIAIRFTAAPEAFLGLQGQVVLNRVQGTPHPYFYAVVVGKPGKGLLDVGRAADVPEKIVIEPSAEGDVEIVVVRQVTSKTSGYRTDVKASQRILETAVVIAGQWIAKMLPAGESAA